MWENNKKLTGSMQQERHNPEEEKRDERRDKDYEIQKG